LNVTTGAPMSPAPLAEYPFASHVLDLDGLRYHYLDEGPRDAPPLLFVHGNPTWSFAWRHLISSLKSDFRCLAVDHIGCGFSDKPQEYDYTLDRHIRNLCRFVESLDLRNVTLVAHDWGGCIGMGAAGRAPDRFARFILMNTAAFRSKSMPFRIAVCRWPVVGAIGVRGMNLFARAALTMAVSKRKLEPLDKRGLLAPYDSWANRIAIHRFVLDIPMAPDHPSYSTLVEIEESLAKQAGKPMLLAWGMRDWCFTPEFLAEWRQRFPQAEVVEFADAGHYLFEDEPEKLVETVQRFLGHFAKSPV
jgi:haloalkane dehalogenase